LFSRFYQLNINPENLKIYPKYIVEYPQSVLLLMLWIAIVYYHIDANLATTSSIRNTINLLKVVIAGAKITQIVGALFRHGIKYISTVEEGIYKLDGRTQG
jgi:dihydroorotate dehydrogenase (fumarate)